MDAKSLIEAYCEANSQTSLAKAIQRRPRYVCEVLAGKHRFSPGTAKLAASELRRAGFIPDDELSELRFELECRNMPLASSAA